MKMFPVCMGGEYMVAMKGNKRKSKTFYYQQISYNGVEFVLDKEEALKRSKETIEFLANEYLQKRIKEVGFVLRRS